MPTRKSTRKSASRSRRDAISLLKADHRQVKGWFSAFEKTRSESRKQDLANKICAALKVHTRIEEDIFYPAFLEHAQEEDIHHEAVVEHDGAKKLIAAIGMMETANEEPRPVREIAADVDLSARQLERLFAKYLRASPGRYYLTVRLDRARAMLLQTTKPILDVAVASGR